MTVKPIPDRYHTVTPYFLVNDGARFIRFLKDAFGGEVFNEHRGNDGRLLNAEVRIGTSMVMLGEPPPPHPATLTMIYLYVPEADRVYASAIQAGATAIAPMADQFYGDRAGAVQDVEGNKWWIATHKHDLTDEEIVKRRS